jgi:hypothetical protein
MPVSSMVPIEGTQLISSRKEDGKHQPGVHSKGWYETTWYL